MSEDACPVPDSSGTSGAKGAHSAPLDRAATKMAEDAQSVRLTLLAALGPVHLCQPDCAAVEFDPTDYAGSDKALLKDITQISTWVAARGTRSKNTTPVYVRCAQRLLLWMQERDLCLPKLSVDDVHAFYEHLSAPPAHWLRTGPQGQPRPLGPGQTWLPTQTLEAPVTPNGLKYIRTVLTQMMGYVQEDGYVRRNVFKLSARQSVATPPAGVSRYLDHDCWDWLWAWIQRRQEDHLGLPSGQHGPRAPGLVDPAGPAPAWSTLQLARDRWLMALLYHTGIRREEAAKAIMNDVHRVDGHWLLSVTGKGNKTRLVTLNSQVQAELQLWRRSLGLSSPMPLPSDKLPLVCSLRRTTPSPIGTRSIGEIVRVLRELALRDCEDEHVRAGIDRMTTHWMRHTNATHRTQAGARLETTQDELGHASINTTRIYAKASREQHIADAQRLVSPSAALTGSAPAPTPPVPPKGAAS